jgi:hypothetical protein
MQTFDDEQRYTQSVDAVLAKYTDPAFLQRKYETLGRQDIRLLENIRDAKRVRLRFAYSDAVDMKVPDFARRFLPERQQIEQTTEWDLASRTGRLHVDAKGSPATLDAVMQLAAVGKGCANRITWTVSVSVPLLGGKLEKLLIEGLRQKAQRDQEVTQRLLST